MWNVADGSDRRDVFLKGSLAASTLLLFVYVGSMYLTEIRPLQELGTNFANVLNAITKTKEILDIPIYEGGTDFPQKHDIELRNVRFSYDGKTDVLHGVNLKSMMASAWLLWADLVPVKAL